ncbi:MAG TPA: hypothetical protein VNJ07_01515 [Chitinophagales bacterium]|nr:hypothetical protein [Chitinophagales bacterium]
MELLRKLYRFFPVQLLILHIKTHQILVCIWLFLFLIITNNWGKSYGIPYLFLDPEYLGEVDFISFSILGAAFGGFLMTWNIAVYILDSYRFPFLATFNRPFALFCLNNFLLPLIFIVTYFIIAIHFQLKQEFVEFKNIILDVSGFISGLFIIIFISAIYFTTTTKNIFAMFGVRVKAGSRITRRMRMRQNMMWEKFRKEEEFPVDHFLTARFKIRRIRGVEHYDEKMILSVLKQNHFSALIIELITLATLIGLGFLIDYEIFNIPAGASILLLLGILVSISGVLSFWLKGWKNTLLIVLLIGLDMFYRFGGFSYDNRAYGLKYDITPAPYSHKNLREIGSLQNMQRDKQSMLAILEKWKKNTGEEKPKLILISVSGGGLSSSLFTTLMLQKIDSTLNGKLFQHTIMITGSSGGMFGAAYMRELYLQKQLGKLETIQIPAAAENISKDLLNSVSFTIVVNDLFFPWQKFSIDGTTYRKDRGYAMERQFNKNTGNIMMRPIGDYAEYEQEAIVPLLLFTPTIINDERRLLISTQRMSYLMRPAVNELAEGYSGIDGVDFQRLFANHHPDRLLLTSAIRMNGTYPYILPNVTMPTEPVIKVMDAGFRDNYGVEAAARFIHVFRDWLRENTSGVILLQVRNFSRERHIPAYHRESIIDRLVNPVTNLYENWGNIQDYNQDYLVCYADEWLDGKLEAIYFEYIPTKKERETSMSLHLTSREKFEIMQTIHQPHIRASLKRLAEAMR